MTDKTELTDLLTMGKIMLPTLEEEMGQGMVDDRKTFKISMFMWRYGASIDELTFPSQNNLLSLLSLDY